ncbi:hypothetical protein DYB30_006151 [Aphanomyces astaci]|uniref:NAD(P)(+) transhydrogenase (Si-specific) n=2 Tax=Aphanomyces astaci TaxID=112090 RepID=A0A397CG73_APHAT|nr:hypothetical protein DYB30_006151 [Aphanomyces astaci]
MLRHLPHLRRAFGLQKSRCAHLSTSVSPKEYDLIVIGSGPSGLQCALESAKMGKSVAIIDKSEEIGGVCVHTGTIPSKTFREASYSRERITLSDILHRVNVVVSSEMDVIRAQLKAAHVQIIPGKARFENANEVSVENGTVHREAMIYRGKKFLIACGTYPAHSPVVPVDGEVILDSDGILDASKGELPKSWIVVGAGVIGMEYASMLNVLPGVAVTVVDGRPDILTFCDDEIVSALKMEMRHKGARFLLGETIQSVTANTDALNLEGVGLAKNKRGLLTVNKQYQTSQPHIYAAGDCIGAPSLASTSLEQGRLAACDMWHHEDQPTSQLDSGNYPYGIYTIPEISMVGKTEQQLTKEGRNYAVGMAKYSELAKGMMAGGQKGALKILFDPDTQSKVRTKVAPHSAFVCQYTSKRCDRARSAKKNGQLHRLCEYHRGKANRFQKAYKLRVTKASPPDSPVVPLTPPLAADDDTNDGLDPIPFFSTDCDLSWNAEDYQMLCDAIITAA